MSPREGPTIRDVTASTAASEARVTAGPTRDAVEPLLHRLLSQAYLFDDPATYEAGVRDAYELLTRRVVQGAVA